MLTHGFILGKKHLSTQEDRNNKKKIHSLPLEELAYAAGLVPSVGPWR